MKPRAQHWVVSVAAVILAMMAIQMSSLGFSPLLPAIRKELGASYSQMGLFTGMYGLIAIFISLPAGILAARFGEKRMLLTGLAVTSLGLASLGLAHSYAVALTSRAVWLIGYRFAFICVFTAMAMGTPEKYRSRTMGILGALAALASVIGAPFGTRLAEWIGWRGGIFGFAVIALLGASPVCGALPSRGNRICACERLTRARLHAAVPGCSPKSRNVGTDLTGPGEHGRFQRHILRALRRGERLRSERKSVGCHHQFQLPVRNLPQSRCRLALRPLFPLEHHGSSGSLADSCQFCRPVCMTSLFSASGLCSWFRSATLPRIRYTRYAAPS